MSTNGGGVSDRQIDGRKTAGQAESNIAPKLRLRGWVGGIINGHLVLGLLFLHIDVSSDEK